MPVNVSNYQELVQSERKSHYKNQVGKKLNRQPGTDTSKTYSELVELLSLIQPNITKCMNAHIKGASNTNKSCHRTA